MISPKPVHWSDHFNWLPTRQSLNASGRLGNLELENDMPEEKLSAELARSQLALSNYLTLFEQLSDNKRTNDRFDR